MEKLDCVQEEHKKWPWQHVEEPPPKPPLHEKPTIHPTSATSTTSSTIQTGPPGLCPYPDPKFAVHLPHSNPAKFYHCSNGVAFVKDCPSPLKFNPKLQVCDW